MNIRGAAGVGIESDPKQRRFPLIHALCLMCRVGRHDLCSNVSAHDDLFTVCDCGEC